MFGTLSGGWWGVGGVFAEWRALREKAEKDRLAPKLESGTCLHQQAEVSKDPETIQKLSRKCLWVRPASHPRARNVPLALHAPPACPGVLT
eukprot:2610666-Pyramimonas_sp.AAC.1